MSKKTLFLTFVVFAIYVCAFSQTDMEYNFSLAEARNFALEHNLLIKNAQLAVNSSEKQKWQAIAMGLPQVDFNLDYINYFNYEIEFSFGAPEGETPELDYTLMDAGDLEILKLLQGFMEPAEPTAIVMESSSSAKFQVSQLLFNGQYFMGVKIASIVQKLTEQSLQKTREDVQELATISYYAVLLTEESMKIMDGNIANLENTLEKSNASLKAGLVEQTDIDQLKMAVSMMLNARNATIRNLEFSYNSLKFSLGLEPNAKISLTDSLEGLLQGANPQNSLNISFNYENNIQYQLISTQEEMSQKMVNMEKSACLPTIAGFYSFNEKIKTTDFDMNPRNLAGMNLSWPIFSSGMRNAKIQEKKIELERTKTNKDLLISQLTLAEKQARFNLNNSIENHQLQKENIELAKRVYQNIERKYSQGILSSLDLTKASDNLLSAQSNYLSSIMQVLQSKLALDKLLNNL